MTKPAIAGILFDKDGTLFDFQGTWRSVVEEILDQIAPDTESKSRMALASGYDPATQRFSPGSVIVAGASSEVAEIWSEHCPGRSAAEIEDLANAAATAIVGSPGAMSPAVPDLRGLLGELRAAGFYLGVATHDSEGAARAQLAGWEVTEEFAFICGYDSGHGLKPGPGMLQAFAHHCGIEPGAVAMVGDSIHDLEMAHNARAALAIGVLTGPALPEDLAHLAHHILPTIGDLPELLSDRRGDLG